MIQLLFTLLAAEAALVLVLLFRTPARRLALLAVDGAKRGRGPVMARTVAATMLVVLGSSGYSIAKIRRRAGELGQLTPTDQVLASRYLLEASLMGYDICGNPESDPLQQTEHQQEEEGEPKGPYFCEMCFGYDD